MQTIDITTTQNVTIEYELAVLRDRILAFFIDSMILGAIYFLLLMLILTAFGQYINDGMMTYALGFLIPILGFMGYHFISELLASGQSWGKKAMGIKVVRMDGKEPNMTDYLLRATFLLVDVLACLGVLGTLLISTSSKNQRFGDMAAGTTVIKEKATQYFRLEDILKINTLENYQPKYLAVKKLSEEDMLLVKNVISRYRSFSNEAHAAAINKLVDRLCVLLEIQEKPVDKINFLRTLIRDYIVLTR